jgi:uncharacterized protein
MLAALVAALALTVAVLTGPTAEPRWGSIAGTAVPASTTASTPPKTWRPSPEPEIVLSLPGVYTVKLADHPLLVNGVSLPDVTCELPRFGRDVASLRAYYTPLRDCLDSAWLPALRAAGLPWTSPIMNMAEHPGEVFCGDFEDGEFTAAYCPDGEMMFFPVDRLIKVDRGGPAVHLGVFAHEYAHHVQATTGLLEAAFVQEDQVGADSPRGQEISRRTELQADCFAGLFLAAAAGRGAISRQLADAAVAGFRYGSLPKTHGTSAHQHSWARRGYQQRTTAACNTWAAPASEVR